MCRERAAQRPQDFSFADEIAGAAVRPFRGTRPLLQVNASVLAVRQQGQCLAQIARRHAVAGVNEHLLAFLEEVELNR